MKRLTRALGLFLVVSAASHAQAGVLAGFERWWGIHCGPGIHAYNGCHQSYMGYDSDADYPEEVAPGISEMDELKSSRRPAQRTTRSYLPWNSQQPASR